MKKNKFWQFVKGAVLFATVVTVAVVAVKVFVPETFDSAVNALKTAYDATINFFQNNIGG